MLIKLYFANYAKFILLFSSRSSTPTQKGMEIPGGGGPQRL